MAEEMSQRKGFYKNVAREGDHILMFALAGNIMIDEIFTHADQLAARFSLLTLVSEALTMSAVFGTIYLMALALNKFLERQGIEQAVRCGIWAAATFVPVTAGVADMLGEETLVARLIFAFAIVAFFVLGYAGFKYCAERASVMNNTTDSESSL